MTPFTLNLLLATNYLSLFTLYLVPNTNCLLPTKASVDKHEISTCEASMLILGQLFRLDALFSKQFTNPPARFYNRVGEKRYSPAA